MGLIMGVLPNYVSIFGLGAFLISAFGFPLLFLLIKCFQFVRIKPDDKQQWQKGALILTEVLTALIGIFLIRYFDKYF